MKAGMAFGCGQCLPCRIKNRRLWAHRLQLEALLYADNSFVTLTYANEHLPKDGLSLGDYTNFLKRFRQRISPLRIRFYGCGEYGELNGRPHYHFVLFGWPSNQKANDLLNSCWGKGFIESEPLTTGRCKYIAKYVVKKMTSVDDERLCGLNPEFSTKSLKPGLGFGMVEHIANTLTRHNLLTRDGDVPVTIAHGGRQVPVGRYLRRALRLHISGAAEQLKTVPAKYYFRRQRLLEHAKAPQHVIRQLQNSEEMQSVRAAARTDPNDPSEKSHLIKQSQGEIALLEKRYQLFTKKGSL